jgi:4-diphosphocytidyl-2-C-methyl-D-erythritol kinase
MSESAAWPAPAKLNLFLHVVGRRADGYHEIQTAYQLVDLEDRLYISPTAQGRIRRIDGPADVPEADDLCIRAARLLRSEAGATTMGADIRIEKRIPIQGGLGGGSSDAATALVALNALWQTGFDDARLAALGLVLGADVPLFIHGRSAWAEGVGERLMPIELPPRYYAVVFPGAGVSTAEVFQAPELTRKTPKTTIRGFLKEGGRNDCEPVAARRNPAVAKALEWLAARGEARLTGTGSCVFAPFASREAAQSALAGLPGEWRGFVVRGLDRSPLLERLAAERSRASGKV